MKKFLTIVVLLVLGITCYILTLKGVPGNPTPTEIREDLSKATKPLELSPERGRYILTYSLAENRSFALNNELGEAAAPDVGVYKDKYFIFFGPGVSMLAVPLYLVGKNFNLSQVFAFSAISIFATLSLIFIYLIARNILKLSLGLSIFASILFGFGSTSWSYAVSMYQHHITTFFILSTFYAVWKYSHKGRWSWIYALYTWLIFGYSIFVDYPNVMLLSPVVIYLFLSSFSLLKQKIKLVISWRLSFLLTSIIFLLLIAVHGYYNYVHFGDWKKLSGELKGYKTIQREKELKAKNQDEKIAVQANKKTAVGFFKEEDVPRSFSILFFSRDRGLFLYAPIFALAVLGIFSIRKKISREIGVLLALVGVNVFLYSSWGDPWGGWAYGPRYLIPSMAILSIFVAVWLNNVGQKVFSRIITFILFAYSAFIALLGALTTNQVPPKVEADFLKMKYNFLLNWEYFIDGKSSSYFFNEHAAKFMTLQEYFTLIYGSLLIIVYVVLFIPLVFSGRKGIMKNNSRIPKLRK